MASLTTLSSVAHLHYLTIVSDRSHFTISSLPDFLQPRLYGPFVKELADRVTGIANPVISAAVVNDTSDPLIASLEAYAIQSITFSNKHAFHVFKAIADLARSYPMVFELSRAYPIVFEEDALKKFLEELSTLTSNEKTQIYESLPHKIRRSEIKARVCKDRSIREAAEFAEAYLAKKTSNYPSLNGCTANQYTNDYLELLTNINSWFEELPSHQTVSGVVNLRPFLDDFQKNEYHLGVFVYKELNKILECPPLRRWLKLKCIYQSHNNAYLTLRDSAELFRKYCTYLMETNCTTLAHFAYYGTDRETDWSLTGWSFIDICFLSEVLEVNTSLEELIFENIHFNEMDFYKDSFLINKMPKNPKSKLKKITLLNCNIPDECKQKLNALRDRIEIIYEARI